MKHSLVRRGSLIAAGALLAGAAHAQDTYRTIAAESFDLPPGTLLGDNGSGTGWLAPWFSGPTGQNAFVFAPGFDPVGGMALTNNPDPSNPGEYASFRRLDLSGFTNITDSQFGSADGPLLGKDGTTLWFRFTTQRFFGGDDVYAGCSFFIFLDPNGVGEYLFMGTPFQVDDYGIDTTLAGSGPGALTTGLGGIDQVTTLVYRIDFQPGDERVRLWQNPTEEYPSGTPDLDADVPDFRFNELRFASGSGGTVGGTTPGWFFDDIKLECQNCPADPDIEALPPTLSVATGGTSNLILKAGAANADKLYLAAGSLSGTTPGIPLPSPSQNFVLPLNIDDYFNLSLTGGAASPLALNFGQLDSFGQGVAQFTLPPGLFELNGLTVHHAYIVIDLALNGEIVFVSDAGALDLVL
jgi:hypothetical protein